MGSQWEIESPIREGSALGKLEQRSGHCVQILRAVGAGPIGGNLRVAGPGEQVQCQARIGPFLAAQDVTDGDVMVAVGVVTQLGEDACC